MQLYLATAGWFLGFLPSCWRVCGSLAQAAPAATTHQLLHPSDGSPQSWCSTQCCSAASATLWRGGERKKFATQQGTSPANHGCQACTMNAGRVLRTVRTNVSPSHSPFVDFESILGSGHWVFTQGHFAARDLS